MGNTATVDIKGDNRQLNKELNESENLVKQFASGVKTAMLVVGTAFAVTSAASMVSGWISDYSKAENATQKLTAQIEATGGSAGYTSGQLATMADDIEKLTGVEAEMVQAGQSVLLLFENIQGAEFDRATSSAVDLSVALGTDVAGASKLLGKALDDPINGLNALSKAGVEFDQATIDMITSMAEAGDVVGAQNIIMDKLDEKVGGVAETMAQTFGGQVTILMAKVGDLGETIAGFLIPYIEALLPAAELAVGGFQMVLDIIGELIGSGGVAEFEEMVTSSFKYITEIAVSSFTYMLAFFETWQMQCEAIAYTALLGFVTTFEDLKKWLTEDLPAYGDWFVNNFTRIFQDAGNFIATVFTNMYDNVASFFSSVYAYLSGDNVEFKWTALTEGFESTLDELPKIAQRKLSDTEKFLVSSIKQVNEEVNKAFETRNAQGQEFVNKMFSKEKKEREGFVTNESNKRRKLEKQGADSDKKEKEKADKVAKEAKAAKEEKSSAGQLVGIEELARRIDTAGASNALTQMELMNAAAGPQAAGAQAAGTSAPQSSETILGQIRDAINMTNDLISRINLGVV